VALGCALLQQPERVPQVDENAGVVRVRYLVVQILHAVYQSAQHLLNIGAGIASNVTRIAWPFALDEDEQVRRVIRVLLSVENRELVLVAWV
jgi:hypothetical protein